MTKEVEIIPTLVDGSTFYEQVVSLDQVDFRLIFEWNSQDLHWFLSIRTSADELIKGCESIRLVKNGWPLRRVRDANRPIGELFVLSEVDDDPGLTTLGTLSTLEYIPRELLDEWNEAV